MDKRHENSLKDIFETIVHEGFVTIEKWKLTSWFNQERF